MKNKTKKVAVLFSLVIGVAFFSSPLHAFFNENVRDIVAAAESDVVSGISATGGNNSVVLIWNTKKNKNNEEAEKYRVKYDLKSVEAGEVDDYEYFIETLDNIPSVKIENLENNKKYYFSVVAIFSDETETENSVEVSATPIGELTALPKENVFPEVISAEAISENKVKIKFSEEVVLPEKNPESAFLITEDGNEEIILEIIRIITKEDETDNANTEKNNEVILETELQTADKKYIVTASAQITNLDDYPIESGTTDTAVFNGFKPLEHPVATEEKEKEEDSIDSDAILEKLEDDSENSENDNVLGLDLEDLPVKKSTDITGDLSDNIESEEESDLESDENDVTTKEGNEEEENPEIAFLTLKDDQEEEEEDVLKGEEKDITPPEDITNLVSQINQRITDFLVTLRWKASKNSSGDLADQVIYRSTDKGKKWDNGKSLGKEAVKFEKVEQPETEVSYKITTKDKTGNESVGVIKSVKLPKLVETGPGILIASGVAFIGFGLNNLRKRKK